MLKEESHVYIAAMQLFPIKLNFSFIKNADVKVWHVFVTLSSCFWSIELFLPGIRSTWM